MIIITQILPQMSVFTSLMKAPENEFKGWVRGRWGEEEGCDDAHKNPDPSPVPVYYQSSTGPVPVYYQPGDGDQG